MHSLPALFVASKIITVLTYSTIDEENDSGITFSHDFKIRSPVHKIAQKVNKGLGVIKHTFTYLDPNIMCLLYINLFHPQLILVC